MIRAVYIISICFLCLSACRDRCVRLEGPRLTFERILDTVSTVDLQTPALLTLSLDTDSVSSISILAQPEIHENIELKNKRGNLDIKLESCFKDKKDVILELRTQRLDKVSSQSAGVIRTNEIIEQDTLLVENEGLGDIELLINTHRIDASLIGSGDILLSGQTRILRAYSENSGDLDALTLYADTVIINNFGSSIIQVYATKYLEVNFFKPTTVAYLGQPELIKTFGTGTLKEADL